MSFEKPLFFKIVEKTPTKDSFEVRTEAATGGVL